jgi:hypothetical protein
MTAILLASGDEAYILYVIILALVGIATLVRKAIEKATSGQKGKRIKLAEVVQRELRKYMEGPQPQPPTSAGEEKAAEAAAPAASEPAARPHAASARSTLRPAAEPAARPPLRRAREEGKVPALVAERRPLEFSAAAAGAKYATFSARLLVGRDRTSLRKGIVMAEILGPPVSERRDHRLF